MNVPDFLIPVLDELLRELLVLRRLVRFIMSQKGLRGFVPIYRCVREENPMMIRILRSGWKAAGPSKSQKASLRHLVKDRRKIVKRLEMLLVTGPR